MQCKFLSAVVKQLFHILQALYLAQEIGASKFTGYYVGWGVNAAGSPAACEIFVSNNYDLKTSLKVAKEWAKIGS
jgi:4-hydroxybutyryl-CoA dehydratase / vinylacetyl-CoA-Delta-isomerase